MDQSWSLVTVDGDTGDLQTETRSEMKLGGQPTASVPLPAARSPAPLFCPHWALGWACPISLHNQIKLPLLIL
jgi:hypothetical protein